MMGQPIDSMYIVVLEEGAKPRAVAAVAGVSPEHVYEHALTGFAAKLNKGRLNALRNMAEVKYIEQDRFVTASVNAAAFKGFASKADGSKCITIAGTPGTKGAATVVGGCNGSASQSFTFTSSGELRTTDGLCVDASGGGGRDLDPIIIWSCHGGINQKWSFTSAGELKGINGKCIDIKSANTGNGTPLILYACHGGNNQKWASKDYGTDTSTPAVEKVMFASKKDLNMCMTVEGSASASGTDIVLSRCAMLQTQLFERRSNGEIRTSGGLCVDATSGSGSNGDIIQIYKCNGTDAQDWTFTSANEFRGFGDKCIDVASNDAKEGQTILLWSCHGGSNQKWTATKTVGSSPPAATSGATTQYMDGSGNPWGLDRLDQRKGLSKSYSYSSAGKGVTAYVLDSGVDAGHPEFEGRARHVWDAFGGDGRDCTGHGTRVAGIIGAKTYGVAKKVQIRSLRIIDCNGNGSSSGLIKALDWVKANRSGPSVANLSIGTTYFQSINDAVTRLAESGVFISVAAGNTSVDACTTSPASTAAGFTVAASDAGDTRASFSNYGGCIDSYAPGVNIASSAAGGGMAAGSGTSYASPHAAGLAALYKSVYGEAASATIAAWIINSATGSVIGNNPSGTPNRLLFKGIL